MKEELDTSSLTPSNLEVVKGFVERIHEGYNLLPNERPIRVRAGVADYDNDQQAIKYLQAHGILTSYNQSNLHFPSYYYVEVELERFMELIDRISVKPHDIAATAIFKPTSIHFIDGKKPVLMWGDTPVPIPANSLPYWILKTLFEAYPNKVEVEDVLRDWGRNESDSTVSDGVGLVNRRIRDALDAQKMKLALVGQRDSYFHFHDDYIESISTDK